MQRRPRQLLEGRAEALEIRVTCLQLFASVDKRAKRSIRERKVFYSQEYGATERGEGESISLL